MISNFEMKVAEIVMTKRREKGFTQEQLARKINVADSFISLVEAHKRKYNLKHINLIAKALKCSPKDLMPESATEETVNG